MVQTWENIRSFLKCSKYSQIDSTWHVDTVIEPLYLLMGRARVVNKEIGPGKEMFKTKWRYNRSVWVPICVRVTIWHPQQLMYKFVPL